MKTALLIVVLINLFAAGELFTFAQTPDTSSQKIPIQYRRGIELQNGWQTYEQKYAGKDLNEEKRRFFRLRKQQEYGQN